jgi:superfamily II DNA or RNA helicase
MNVLYEKNGFIYIHNEDLDIDYPDWITTDYPTGDPYFLLNNTTRIHFKEFFLPYLKEGKFKISKILYEDIKNFVQNPARDAPTSMFTYIGSIKLKPHQINAINNMLTHKRFAFFYGTGTGKTLIAISYLYSYISEAIAEVDKPFIYPKKHIIIVTPKKVIPQYEEECKKYLKDFYKINTTGDCSNPYTITIINFESLHKVKCKWCDCLIIDESHKAKSYTSEINKQLRVLSNKSDEIYLFTGTPIDKSRHEIFPQLAILDERVYPSKTRFNYRYYNIDDYHNPKSEKGFFKDEITDMIQSYSEAVKTTDVVDLPELENVIIECNHPEDYHDELRKDSMCTVNIPGTDATGICIADTPATVRTKQQEVCSGFLLDIEVRKLDFYGKLIKKYKEDKIVLHTKILKQHKLKELIEERKFTRGIIFTNFTAEIELVQEVTTNLCKSSVIINGDTPTSKVNEYKELLRKKDIDFIIANVNCTNAGLDMYFINKVLFYSLPDSYITYHQCVSRIYRMGQVHKCYVYHLICKDSVESAKYKALSTKKNFTNKFYASYKEVK